MDHNKQGEYLVYPSRWYMLAMFCFLDLANAVLWVTFAPISDLTSDYFGGISLTEVNMLALIFQIAYLPGTGIYILINISKHSNIYTVLI